MKWEEEPTGQTVIDFGPICTALATHTGLRHFSVVDYDACLDYIHTWPTLPNLRSLDLGLGSFGPATWSFICSCPLLESLTLRGFDHYEGGSPPDLVALASQNTTTSPLACLTSLGIEWNDSTRQQIDPLPLLHFFFADPPPSPLIHVYLEGLYSLLDDPSQLLSTLRRVPPTVRRLDWVNVVLGAIDPALARQIKEILSTSPLNVKFAEFDRILAQSDPDLSPPSVMSETKTEVRALLEWAMSKLDGLECFDDEAGAIELLRILGGLKMRYEIEKQ